jgi:acetyl esterase/lipase
MNKLLRLIPIAAVILALFLAQACAFHSSTAFPTTSYGTNTHVLVPIDPSKLGKVEHNVTYGTADGVALKMDVYYPEMAEGVIPAVIYVHGGAWIEGDKETGVGATEIPELRSRGYLVAAVNYRLAPEYKFPAQIEDVKCAVRFLRANAANYGIDPDRIGAWGGSAGGHLVALLGVTDASAGFEGDGGYENQSSRVQAVVDMYGPTDLTELFRGVDSRFAAQIFGIGSNNSDILKSASPVTWISSDDPPFLILHGEEDELVPPSQSKILYDRLVAAGVLATLVMVKNAGHGFLPVGGTIDPSRQEITKMVADFFDRYLK